MTGPTSAGSLDTLDLTLLGELEADARQSIAQLGVRFGVSPRTVSRRIGRLQREHHLRFKAVVHPLALGTRLFATIGVKARPGKASMTASRLSEMPEVTGVQLVTGRYDVIVYAAFTDSFALAEFVLDTVSPIPGVAKVETAIMLRSAKWCWGLLGDERATLRIAPRRRLRPEELAMIWQLETSPLQPLSQLAVSLGISRPTAISRFETLLSEGALRIVGIASSIRLNFRIHATIFIQTEPSHINSAAQKIAAYENIRAVSVFTGPHDLIAEAAFEDSDLMTGFLVHELSQVPGVLNYETAVVAQEVKPYSWALPPPQQRLAPDPDALSHPGSK